MTNPFSKYLKDRTEKISSYLKTKKIEAFRGYDNELDGFPVLIDIYGKYAHVQLFDNQTKSQDFSELEKIVSSSIQEVFKIEKSNQIWKTRKQQKGKSQYEKISHSKNMQIISEYESKFYVNLLDYLDTGLFLDHRETRQIVANLSKEKERLLNLFSYTGSFSICAAKEGVRYTTSVDMSNTYTDWAKMNFLLNEMDKFNHIAIRENVFTFLITAKNKNWKYDIIVIDPPTFSNSKKMRHPFDIQKDYPKLINLSLDLLNEDGIILFSTNFKKFKMNEDMILAKKITDITKDTIPIDFTNTNIHRCFLISKR